MMKKSFALSIALHVSVIAGVLFWMLYHKEPLKPKVIPVTIVTVVQPQKVVSPQPVQKPKPIEKPVVKPKPIVKPTPKPIAKPTPKPIVKEEVKPVEKPKPVEQPKAEVTPKAEPKPPVVDTTKVQDVYLAYVHQSAEKLKSYPRNAKRLHQEGVVMVHFVILADGTLTDISLSKSSGFGMLDEAALKIITTLAKLKPIPKELGKEK